MNFATYKEKYFDFLCDDPNFCVYSGVVKNLGDLPDPGKNKRITNQGKIKMFAQALMQIDKSTLSFDDQIDYELCQLHLEQYRLEYELEIDGVPMNMRMPRAASTISDPIFQFFINDPRDPKHRLVNIISRLDKVPDYLISYKRNLVEPVERWVKMEQQSLAGLPGFFATILDWAKEVGFARLEVLENSINKATTALKLYEDFLDQIPKSKNIVLGEKQMQEVLHAKGIKLSPSEIHQIAKDFTARNEAEVEKLRVKLIAKYNLDVDTSAEELQKILNQKYAVKRKGEGFQFILDRYQSEREKILAFIKERNLFPVMDDQDMKILQTPDFMKPTIPAGAMMPPLPMREGVKTSLVYLTLNEELLAEHTEISIPCMMIHEGIPGHHLQLAWAAKNPSTMRRIFSFMDLCEGWTTMLEDYMMDQGYAGDLADEMRFSGKRDIARIGARVAIDLYFMSGDQKYLDIGIDLDFSSDDVFENAGKLLQAVTGFVDDRINGELNWYSTNRGYPLSYLTGNYLVWKLKHKVQHQMSDLEFHTKFLNAGNVPVAILEKIFEH